MTIIGEELVFSNDADPRVGEVIETKRERVSDEYGRTFTRVNVLVGDESDVHPDEKNRLRQLGDHFEEELERHPEWQATEIVKVGEYANGLPVNEIKIDPNNEAAIGLYKERKDDGSLVGTQMEQWALDFPTAIALEPLQRLRQGGRLLPGGHVDERTLHLFTYMIDAIGIRARARIYADRVTEIASQLNRDLEVMSIGCGAAVPNIEATLKTRQEVGKSIHWNFFDFDKRALGFAEELFAEAGIHAQQGMLDFGPLTKDNQYWKYEGRNMARAFKEPSESVDIVDALGLWEYLPEETAIKFMERAYDKVRPGGSVIVSNMLESRPQKLYNQKAVGWPDLEIRSEKDLLDIAQMANVDPNQVTFTHSEDGVYVVMEVCKP